MNDELIFEIIDAPQHIKIFRSGKVEGVNKNALRINWLFAIEAKDHLARFPKRCDIISNPSGSAHIVGA